MFARISKTAKAVVAVVAASSFLIACDSGLNMKGSSVVAAAPEYNATYRDGEDPSERTGEFAITTNQCPSTEDVNNFIERYSDEDNIFFTMDQDKIRSDGYEVMGLIDHYSYETVIGTIDASCLPSLDGSIEYRPGAGNERLRQQWFNFQNVYVTALDMREEELSQAWSEISGGDGSDWWANRWQVDEFYEDTEPIMAQINYSVSLQLLGIVSALSGGVYFNSYGNQVPHLTNPETYDGSEDASWSTELQTFNNPIAFHYYGGEEMLEEMMAEADAKFSAEFESKHGMTVDQWLEESDARIAEMSESLGY